ncbi:MAG: hypothetical protein D6722_17140, partial [Bacteroidetes bacterium]
GYAALKELEHLMQLGPVDRPGGRSYRLAQVAQGIFLPEPYPGAFAALLQRFEILSDFWMAAAEILYDGPEDERLSYYLRLNFQALYPYLSPAGQTQFHSLLGI